MSSDKKQPPIIRKSTARLAAVQALYSYDLNKGAQSADEMTIDLVSHYNDQQGAENELVLPDKKFLARLVDKTSSETLVVDGIIIEFLAENWTIDKLGSVIKSILRCAVTELKYMPEIPSKVVINEYTTLTRSFYGDKEIGFVNGILEKIALKIRPEEF